jgi:hypothetical protein
VEVVVTVLDNISKLVVVLIFASKLIDWLETHIRYNVSFVKLSPEIATEVPTDPNDGFKLTTVAAITDTAGAVAKKTTKANKLDMILISLLFFNLLPPIIPV